jgi:hypothetical protein
LKKSKIERLRKSRERQFLVVSAAASLFSIGGQQSLLQESMWSLTSQRLGRTSGAKKSRSSTRKDFFNNIGTKQTS